MTDSKGRDSKAPDAKAADPTAPASMASDKVSDSTAPDKASDKAPDSSRRSERSRRAIYAAALDLVSENGYARTTVEGIASRAGVGKQTIYRWWPVNTKPAVLMEAFLDLAEQADEALGGSGGSEIPDTGDLAADLKLVLRATVDELNNPVYDRPTRALAAEGIVDPGLGAQFTARLLEPALQQYVRRIEAAQAAGDVDPSVDPRIALELLVGPLHHRWLHRTRPLTHAYADTLVDYALGGLGARP